MASIYKKRGTWWARVKGDKEPGKWSGVPTGYALDKRDEALEFASEAQRSIDKRRCIKRAGTFRSYVKEWLDLRREAGHDWKKDRGRLDKHVLPVLGEIDLSDVTTAQVATLVHGWRFKSKLANRTVRNIYSVLAAALRDARIAGLIEQTPCILTEVQLGAIVDQDPEWRDGAVFTRDEAQSLISDPRIPLDRRVVYAFGLLAGMRPGEIAALRWRHYDATCEPLGRLTIALSYSTTRSATKRTKTNTVKNIPVHATLATLLAEWRLAGALGVEPEDLIVPLPPDVKRTKRTGDRFRGYDYTGRRWRDEDLPMLGWRERSVYDTKSTFITLAIEDGADPGIIRDRVTHTKPRRDAFGGYDRGEHWLATCREVAKLNIVPLATTVLPQEIKVKKRKRKSGSGGGYRMAVRRTSGPPKLQVLDGGRDRVPTSCDLGMASLVANLRPREAVKKSTVG